MSKGITRDVTLVMLAILPLICFRSSGSDGIVKAADPDQPKPIVPSSPCKVAIYDADPDHLWNSTSDGGPGGCCHRITRSPVQTLAATFPGGVTLITRWGFRRTHGYRLVNAAQLIEDRKAAGLPIPAFCVNSEVSSKNIAQDCAGRIRMAQGGLEARL